MQINWFKLLTILGLAKLCFGCVPIYNYASPVDADLVSECQQAGGKPVVDRTLGEGGVYTDRYGGCN